MTLPRPEAILVRICTVCGQRWKDHLDLVLHYDEEGNVIENLVTLSECITLLKRANQGPPGPPGVTGPMGPQGIPGRSDVLSGFFDDRD